MDFLTDFKELCGKGWNLTAETSLQVPREAVEQAAEVVGDFIVDIKESNPDIYRALPPSVSRASTALPTV